MCFSEGISQAGALCRARHAPAAPAGRSRSQPARDTLPGTRVLLPPSSFWAIRGTSGFTFLPLRAQFSTLGMPKIQAQYLQRENNPGCCGEEPRTSAQHRAGATRGTPLHVLQSTPSPALRCWAARGSPGAKEVSLAPTHWQNPLRGEP